MRVLFHDLRLTLRILAKSPGTSVLAIVVLGLGIGANSAMFSLVDALLFRPLAVESPEELVGAYVRHRETGNYRAFSYPDFRDLREQTDAFERLAAHHFAMVGLDEDGATRRTFVDAVSSNWFATFGVSPILGRAFLPEEELPGRDARVAILGHSLWQRRGSDPGVVGTTLELNGESYTVVGVAPPGFSGSSALIAPELYVPLSVVDRLTDDWSLSSDRSMAERDNRFLIVIGRLGETIDLEAASRDAARVASLLEQAYPVENQEITFEAHELSRVSVSTSPESDTGLGALAVLLLGMALVLLTVAALNLATVQSARALARQPEIAVRLAMGSGRWPVVRQLLAEGLVLSLGGGVLGLVAAWGVPRLIERSVLRLAPFDIQLASSLDLRIVLATLGFCVLATLLFGLAPALRASRPDLVQALREGGPGSGGGRRGLLSRANLPVLAEIALTLVLLVVGGLFLKAALQAASADPGFETDGLVLAETDTSFLGWDETRGADAARELRDRLGALPGVRAVDVAATVPFGMVSVGSAVAPVEEALPEDGGRTVGASNNWVGPQYFEAIGLPILRGRTFRDSEPTEVGILNEELAERLWPGADPVGRSVRTRRDDRPVEIEIVGLVPTTRDSLLEREPAAVLYQPFSRQYFADHHYHLRLDDQAAAEALLPTIRQTMLEIDERLPIVALHTFESHLDQSAEVWMMRSGARIFGTFAVVGLVLAMAGVYGVRAYSVGRRTRELGIRMALGSSVRATLWLVLGEGLRLGAVGIGAGLLLALATSRLLSSFLFGVGAWDPWVFAGALFVLLAIVGLACLVPARRAASLDPLVALRYE